MVEVLVLLSVPDLRLVYSSAGRNVDGLKGLSWQAPRNETKAAVDPLNLAALAPDVVLCRDCNRAYLGILLPVTPDPVLFSLGETLAEGVVVHCNIKRN